MSTDIDDLITVAELAEWSNTPTGATAGSTQNVFQEVITGWSKFVLWKTGRVSGYFTGTGGDYTQFNEVRDGNGSDSMGLLYGPASSIVSVVVSGMAYGQSLAWNQGGWFIEQGGMFIGLRSGSSTFPADYPMMGNQFRFTRGKGNVLLTYKGIYKAVPPDLLEASLKACTVIVSKRLREDEGGKMVPQTGSVTNFRAWKWPPEVSDVLLRYTRTIFTMG